MKVRYLAVVLAALGIAAVLTAATDHPYGPFCNEQGQYVYLGKPVTGMRHYCQPPVQIPPGYTVFQPTVGMPDPPGTVLVTPEITPDPPTVIVILPTEIVITPDPPTVVVIPPTEIVIPPEIPPEITPDPPTSVPPTSRPPTLVPSTAVPPTEIPPTVESDFGICHAHHAVGYQGHPIGEHDRISNPQRWCGHPTHPGHSDHEGSSYAHIHVLPVPEAD